MLVCLTWQSSLRLFALDPEKMSDSELTKRLLRYISHAAKNEDYLDRELLRKAMWDATSRTLKDANIRNKVADESELCSDKNHM